MARKRDPEESGGDDLMKAANARAAKEIEDAERAEKETGDPSKEREVSIEEDDDDDEPSPAGRRERRNGRSAHQQAREEAERRAEAAESRTRQLETHNLALAAIVGTPRGPAAAPEPSPVDQDLERIQIDQERLADEWEALDPAKRNDKATFDDYRGRMRKLKSRELELAVQRNRAPAGPSPQQIMAEETLKSDYPDVMAHAAGKGIVAAEFRALELLGHEDSLATLKLAAAAARKRLGLGTDYRRAARTPDESLKAKLAGGTFRSHGGGPDPRATTIRMSKEDRTMARSMYPSLSGMDAEKRWAQKVGSKLVKSGERE